jgi:hypothetical protein
MSDKNALQHEVDGGVGANLNTYRQHIAWSKSQKYIVIVMYM